jgi:HEAT repeat protein
VPLLVKGAADDDSQVRIYSLWALGAIADPSGFATLTASLVDTDPGIRKTAAYALGGFADHAAAAEAVRPLADDPVADVRWNAALALARLGDTSGQPVLEQMLDRRLLAQVPDITPEQQEDAMISALNALVALDVEIDSGMLDRLAADDPSYKVRQAAIEARKSRAAGRQGEHRELASDRLASAPVFFSTEPRLVGSTPQRSLASTPSARPPEFSSESRLVGSTPHRSLASTPSARPPELTPCQRFDYIRGFPVCPGSLPQQGRV